MLEVGAHRFGDEGRQRFLCVYGVMLQVPDEVDR